MVNELRIHSILVVTGSKRDFEFISSMLSPSDYRPVAMAGSANEASRMMINTSYDIIIVDAPLPDQYGHEFAVDASRDSLSGIVLMVKGEAFDIVASKVDRYGVLAVAKPVSRQFFLQLLRLATATRERLRQMEKKNTGLQEKIEEIRLVNRAKWVLIERLSMNEPQAHKYIERQAMDMRLTRREIAENIIRTHGSV